jgi:hypothetical protein
LRLGGARAAHGADVHSSVTLLMRCLGASVLLLLLTTEALALILSARGNDPVQDNNWPAGALELANRSTRIGW